MKTLSTILFAALAALILASAPSGAADPPAAATDHPAAPGDIVSVSSGADGFKTLVAAIKAAGLAETLQGEGPFTIFAPTDEAFAKLPEGALDDLLKPENKAKLAGILTYHVLPAKVMAADAKTMKAKTLNGLELMVKVEEGKVTVDNAKVVKADIAAANGVIHAIDTVLLPASFGADPAKAKPKDHPGH